MPEIKAGFLPLYLKLYDDAMPGEDEQFAPYLQSLKNRIEECGVTLISPGVIFDTPHVERAKRMFAEEHVSFVITVHLAYSPSLLVADFLENLNVPILVLDTTPEFTFENLEKNYLMRNHGIHGVMDLTSVLTSRGVAFDVISGHPDDGVLGGKIKQTVLAFQAAALMRNQRAGITGEPFSGMGDFAINFSDLERDFGTTVVDIPVERIVRKSKVIAGALVARRIEEDKSIWDVSEISEEDHSQAVRDYLALRSIVEEEGISAYTMNFQHIGEQMPTPFYACSGLMSEGIGYGGEGDVLTSTFSRPLNLMSSAAKFDEFFCADWKNDRILMSHMGETDSRFIKSGTVPRLVPRDAMLNPNVSVIYRFQAEPGEVTFVNLSPVRGGGYRLVAGLLDIVDSPVLDEISGPHYQVSTRIPVGRFLERYASEGGGHHLYIAKGDIMEGLAIFCKQLEFDYRIIDTEVD